MTCGCDGLMLCIITVTQTVRQCIVCGPAVPEPCPRSSHSDCLLDEGVAW